VSKFIECEKHGSKSKLPLFFWGLLLISVIAYFETRHLWIHLIFAHLGGFSIVGLFACLAGSIARKKNYSYRNAFLAGLILPIIAGFIGVLILFPPDPALACGGSATLIVGLLIVIVYSLLKKKAVMT
jgi:FtsH-binding integral membrane protein